MRPRSVGVAKTITPFGCDVPLRIRNAHTTFSWRPFVTGLRPRHENRVAPLWCVPGKRRLLRIRNGTPASVQTWVTLSSVCLTDTSTQCACVANAVSTACANALPFELVLDQGEQGSGPEQVPFLRAQGRARNVSETFRKNSSGILRRVPSARLPKCCASLRKHQGHPSKLKTAGSAPFPALFVLSKALKFLSVEREQRSL